MQDSASLSHIIHETKTRPPFILELADSFHIIADNRSVIKSYSVSEALLHLFCIYYVFDIRYSNEVMHSLLFIQSQILGKVDSFTSACKPLLIFVNLLSEQEAQDDSGND